MREGRADTKRGLPRPRLVVALQTSRPALLHDGLQGQRATPARRDLTKEMSGHTASREPSLALGGMFGVATLPLTDAGRSALAAPGRVARLRRRIGTARPGKPSRKNPAFTQVRTATDPAGMVPVAMARIPG